MKIQLSLPGSIPKSLADHHRQVVWQIWVPLGVTLAGILALCALVILNAAGQASSDLTGQMMSISVIFLTMPVLFGALLGMLVMAVIVYLMVRLLRFLPPYTQLAQAYAHYFSVLVRFYADKIVQPVINLRSALTSWQALFRSLFGK
jgi:hypothetical protein